MTRARAALPDVPWTTAEGTSFRELGARAEALLSRIDAYMGSAPPRPAAVAELAMQAAGLRAELRDLGCSELAVTEIYAAGRRAAGGGTRGKRAHDSNDELHARTAKAPLLAHTAEQAAAIIGGTCKASRLKAECRAGVFPHLKIGGAYNFTDAHIQEIIRLCEFVPKKPAAAPGLSAKGTPAKPSAGPLPFPVTGVPQLQARESRRRGRKPEAT